MSKWMKQATSAYTKFARLGVSVTFVFGAMFTLSMAGEGCSKSEKSKPAPALEENTSVLDLSQIDPDGDGFANTSPHSLETYIKLICEPTSNDAAGEMCTSTLRKAVKYTGDCPNPQEAPEYCAAVTAADCHPSKPDLYQCEVCINPHAPEILGDGVDNDCDGIIDECSSNLDCYNGSSCTIDTCNVSTHVCSHSPVTAGTTCSDNSVCTQNDQCDGAGLCVGTTTVDCNDENPCTKDKCDPLMGCFNPPYADGMACDDGDLCTQSTQCLSGICTNGSAMVCDDGNAHTTNICHPKIGCINKTIDKGEK